ncbi:tetratricopeptide repeat protein [Paratractidigestivibacter sp.]|uniref:tetratricopeptide repeat protein n=1 Tax=Paratractidigestivibacter sp. TaxID=2847316 RepID=UPI002AC8D922|nr:tetratricopeptide repeat protein [Paratractidigestivibacter sp.]
MAQQNTKKSTNKADNLGIGAKFVIALFALLMAFSLVLPMLSSVLSSTKSTSTSTDTTTDTSSESADDSEEKAEVEKADDKYGALVSSLEEKYASDSTNLATLLNLGKDYMAWGAYVRYYGSTDSDTTHANELLDKAVTYYDEYLAQRESSAVRVDKALCAYYQEDGTSALNQLKALTESAPDYGPAWANLGLVYESSGDTDSAKEAYAKAEEADPNDEYGAKTYAEQRLSSLDSSESTDESSSDSATSTSTSTGSSTTSSSSTSQGLSDTLSELNGL